MLRLTRSKLQPIGLDIGTDSIRMIQLDAAGESPVVCGYAWQSIPSEARAQPAIHLPLACDIVKDMLRHHGFTGKNVVASIPRSMIHVKNLRLPMMPAADLAAAVQFEAKSVFPFDAETTHIQHIRAGEVRQGGDSRQEVIVLAVKQDDVENYLELLHRCGAIVESLDFEPCAVYRSIERFIRRREDEKEVNVLADIGLRRTNVIIGRGREIHFLKPIEVGGFQLNEAVARKLGITFEEARALRQRLAEQPDDARKNDSVRQAVYDTTRTLLETLGREIGLCLRYHSVTFRGQRPSRVRLVGGEANDPQVISVLNVALSVPVEPAKSLINLDTSRMKPHDRQGSMCAWATALGLGLKLTNTTFAARDGKPREILGRPVDTFSIESTINPSSTADPKANEAENNERFMQELEFVPSWYPRMRRRQNLLKLQSAFTFVVVALLGAWTIKPRAGISNQRAIRALLDSHLTSSCSELALLNEQVDLKSQLEQQKGIMDRLGRHVESSRMLALMQSSLSKQVAILDLKINTIESSKTRPARDTAQKDETTIERREQVTIVGVAPSDLDISEFLENLSRVRFCENVQLTEASDFTRDGHLLRKFEVVFAINLTQGGATW